MFNPQKIKVADVLEVEASLRALIRDKYPDINVERGSSLNDLLITSLGYLAAAIKSDTDSIKERLYLGDLISSGSAESYILLQDIASNFLVSSTEAPPKRGMVTFTFSTDIDRTIPASLLLSRAENFVTVKLFDTANDLLLTASDYVEVTEGDSTVYQHTLLMESVSVADDVVIVPGTFNSSVPLVDLVGIANATPFVGASISEFGNRSLVSKIEYAQTLRTFSTRSGIQATILDQAIPNIKRVLAIGAQDPEMARDLLPSTLTASKFHSLGMSNVLVASDLTEKAVPIDRATNLLGGLPILGLSAVFSGSLDVPIVSDFGQHRYTKVFDTPTGATSISYELIEEGSSLPDNTVSIGLTDSEEQYLNGSSSAGKFLLSTSAGSQALTTVRCWVDNNLPVIQGLVDSDVYRPVAASTIAISANLTQVMLPSLKVSIPSNASVSSVNVTRIKNTAVSFINTWNQDYPLTVSALLNRLSLVYGGIAAFFSLGSPARYVVYLPDGRLIGYQTTDTLEVEDATKQLSPNSVSYESVLAPLQVSNRTLSYYITSDDLNVEVVNV